MPIKHKATIVFSASSEMRNYLRNKVSEGGFRTVCFENDRICLDNLESIQPEIVIAETDSAEVVWRFVFALRAVNEKIPLIVVSDRLKDGLLSNDDLQVFIQTIATNHLESSLIDKLNKATKPNKSDGGGYDSKRMPLFVGNTEPIVKIRSMLPSIANTSDPLLIAGERGTGKELLACMITGLAKCQSRTVKIDCGKIGPEMIADAAHTKIMGLRNKGLRIYIFLDHLEQLTLASQAEMLLLIDAAKSMRNGSEGQSNEGIRFIAAADRNIEGLVEKGDFRKDLFYRLNVIPISIPALRERKADVSLLMDYFIIKACIENKQCIKIPSQKAREICMMHDWPGNVRELQNRMWRLVEEGSEAHLLESTDMCKRPKNKQYLLNRLAMEELPKPYEIKDFLPLPKNMSLKGIRNEFVARTERRLMKKALESTSWNRKKAAELLNISYKSMLNKIKTYDII